jgi:hypothetical protein
MPAGTRCDSFQWSSDGIFRAGDGIGFEDGAFQVTLAPKGRP